MKTYLPELDGLRAVAAIIVVVSHCANAGFLPAVLGNGVGQQGVALFYLLSSFLISRLYLDQTFTAANIGQYAVARAARVLPLFYAMIAVSIALYMLTDISAYKIYSFETLIRNIFLIHGTAVLWSIPVEIQFYAIFLVIWLLNSRGVGWLILPFLLAMQVALISLAGAYETSLGYWLHFFTLGWLATKFKGGGTTRWHWVPALVLLATPILLPQLRRDLGWSVGPNYSDPFTIALPILVFFLVIWNSKFFSVLASPALRYVGSISFGIYLIHWPIIIFVEKASIGNFISFSLVLFGSIALAALSFHLFEKPFQRKLRRLASPKSSA